MRPLPDEAIVMLTNRPHEDTDLQGRHGPASLFFAVCVESSMTLEQQNELIRYNLDPHLAIDLALDAYWSVKENAKTTEVPNPGA